MKGNNMDTLYPDKAQSYNSENILLALREVTDRLALHAEYEKYSDIKENYQDRHIIRLVEKYLEYVKLGIPSPRTRAPWLLNVVTDRLRLHTVQHQYDDAGENFADITALMDAESILN